MQYLGGYVFGCWFFVLCVCLSVRKQDYIKRNEQILHENFTRGVSWVKEQSVKY